LNLCFLFLIYFQVYQIYNSNLKEDYKNREKIENNYKYSKTGNILEHTTNQKDKVRQRYFYEDKSLPQAVTKTLTKKRNNQNKIYEVEKVFSYNKNGDMISRTIENGKTQKLSYDNFGRLQSLANNDNLTKKIAQYSYNTERQRISKKVNKNGKTENRRYPNKLTKLKSDNTFEEYIFSGSERIATLDSFKV